MASCQSSKIGTTNDNTIFSNATAPGFPFLFYSGKGDDSILLDCMGLKSNNNKYSFSVRSDGNLILYDIINKNITWQSGTNQSSDGYTYPKIFWNTLFFNF